MDWDIVDEDLSVDEWTEDECEDDDLLLWLGESRKVPERRDASDEAAGIGDDNAGGRD